VRSRLVPFCSRLGPSLGPLPRLWPRILRQPSGSPAMPRSEDRWRPACRQLATARSRRVTFHQYKGTERRRTVTAGSGEKSRSPGRPSHAFGAHRGLDFEPERGLADGLNPSPATHGHDLGVPLRVADLNPVASVGYESADPCPCSRTESPHPRGNQKTAPARASYSPRCRWQIEGVADRLS
jgi:hypothetical protein